MGLSPVLAACKPEEHAQLTTPTLSSVLAVPGWDRISIDGIHNMEATIFFGIRFESVEGLFLIIIISVIVITLSKL